MALTQEEVQLGINAVRLAITGLQAIRQYNIDAAQVTAVIENAEAEGRDVTDAEIDVLVAHNAAALDALQQEIDQRPE